MKLSIGLDVGSTTVKIVVLNEENQIVYSEYKRHYSEIGPVVQGCIRNAYQALAAPEAQVTILVTGSGGFFVEENLGIQHIQEVVAGLAAIRQEIPQTDVAIELGGEDSKITFVSGGVEQRMNSICAGGTGAFIDQMAALLETDAAGLNQLSKGAKKIYPIASRCGVFAKTDLQALMNQGAAREDLARSVFQSIVNQTISNLACGRTIEGNIAFLGGPLHFLSELRQRFEESLAGPANSFYHPHKGQLYVALGAAYSAREAQPRSFSDLLAQLDQPLVQGAADQDTLEPLFASPEERKAFEARHQGQGLVVQDLASYQGPLYLGLDAGSTTSKAVLLGADNQILYTKYGNNQGKPLDMALATIREIYENKHPQAYFAQTGITGYGEDFIQKALNIDRGEVETICHYRAAQFFKPDVDFIIDIGGQDMKAMHISQGVIDSIQLNEACSSGCGSFIETFARSLGMSLDEFQEEALAAKNPVDLGSRCTVFMNSMVKQAQKDGASVGDIAAGLCYSVMKNAIFKVIKVRDPQDLGQAIVVQGGTFYGDASLRAFEKVTGRQVVRPALAGLMGALGMALIAKEKAGPQARSSLLDQDQLQAFSYQQRQGRCGLCENRCALQINIFSDGSRYITGNRCERGAGRKAEKETSLPNLYEYKKRRLFQAYLPLTTEEAWRGTMGLPRVLNMYENYPLWFTFFTSLGFRVVLSSESSRATYERGISSIVSETACYPAKLAHGHVEELIDQGVKTIFYPSVFYEKQEFDQASNHINCPVVTGYPEVIKNNVDRLKTFDIKLLNPFLNLADPKNLKRKLHECLAAWAISQDEINRAVDLGLGELANYRADIRAQGQEALAFCRDHQVRGLVLAGRPYHVDPEVNHGISQLIQSLGLVVLTEDSILSGQEELDQPLRVLDQWSYHARLYRAAALVGATDYLELVQLNSFGCGLDAVTTDQVQEILKSYGKIYTQLKIDEVSNLGAAKIRLRSLIQALEGQAAPRPVTRPQPPATYTRAMKDYTILAPQMAKDHFHILQGVLEAEGYGIEFLQEVDSRVIDQGLKYVNNDACYPAITVVGQLMEAIESGRYDVNRLALLMTQTGGACRASNYVGWIRKALADSGHPQIPVIALSAQGIESSGFELGLGTVQKALLAILYGDLLMRLANQVRPYEELSGQTDAVKDKWLEKCRQESCYWSRRRFRTNVQEIIRDFARIPWQAKDLPKVGLVGEILVKYLPEANNHLQDLLEEEGCEVLLPDLADFLLYCLRNAVHKKDLFHKSRTQAWLGQMGVRAIEWYRDIVRQELEKSRFQGPLRIEDLEAYVAGHVSLGHQYGEGWLLTAEMIECIQAGAPNIVCMQPFGCLPNHITGKGMIKKVRELYPGANIIPIDYDPGASEVNQINRVRLMLAQGREQAGKTSWTQAQPTQEASSKKQD